MVSSSLLIRDIHTFNLPFHPGVHDYYLKMGFGAYCNVRVIDNTYALILSDNLVGHMLKNKSISFYNPDYIKKGVYYISTTSSTNN
ncbi:hypothetical protein SAMD00019534_099320 [Acytostelium subglobosum LB1]|uniref:hypothetical protein n=1 Tax=Acytostelium subglobosum LB1 TaxID=1410327 RepID=UPI000644D190|nr:hypothetical protein SAMD00019534_099320 [Acytostelium subglobosum LB1]GAM26757.1 hypothetical protein SAMD00019534_099320 [Acytostelium subglobosum LB1]|eukprot:XP_012750418.1 hypothetical protein SAMD00019534_099320 [Acytostelium subglobosum LB1]